MKSTGEVMGIDTSFGIAFAKAQLGGGMRLPQGGKVFISVRDEDKPSVDPGSGKTLSRRFRDRCDARYRGLFRSARDSV